LNLSHFYVCSLCPCAFYQVKFFVLLFLFSSPFFKGVVLNRSSCMAGIVGVTFMGVVDVSVVLVDPLISSPTWLLRMSSVFITNKVHLGWLATRCAKWSNLRVTYLSQIIPSNLGFSTMFRPWLSCTGSTACFSYPSMGMIWYLSNQGLLEHGHKIFHFS
jgi:hypothetical protein